jgi:hypothetical protein
VESPVGSKTSEGEGKSSELFGDIDKEEGWEGGSVGVIIPGFLSLSPPMGTDFVLFSSFQTPKSGITESSL